MYVEANFSSFISRALLKTLKMTIHCISGMESFPVLRVKVRRTLTDLGPIFQALIDQVFTVNKKAYIAFVGLLKAFDNVNWNVMMKILTLIVLMWRIG